jgi:hypothetical protein
MIARLRREAAGCPVGYSGMRAGRGSVDGASSCTGRCPLLWEWQLQGRWRLSRGATAPSSLSATWPSADVRHTKGGNSFTAIATTM